MHVCVQSKKAALPLYRLCITQWVRGLGHLILSAVVGALSRHPLDTLMRHMVHENI